MKEDISILIIEDDVDINNLLNEIVSREGYQITQAYSGTEAKLLLDRGEYDLVLLDLMLPGMTGEELVKLIREKYIMPIIIISAKIDTASKVELLKLGSDDFIEKPFENEEVIARVEAQLRRYLDFTNKEEEVKLSLKNLELVEEERKLLVSGKEIKLTVKEYDILYLLLSNPKKVFTKSNLLNSVWGDDQYLDENTLNVHISNIRTKIGRYDFDNEYIETVWGIGYRLNI